MIELNVKEMTCGHCVGAVTRAVRSSHTHASWFLVEFGRERSPRAPRRLGAAQVGAQGIGTDMFKETS
jgi:hypothetical protein